MRFLVLLSFLGVVVSEAPQNGQRITGGSASTVGQYPFMANLQYGWMGWIFYQYCGGILITTDSILSAATCFRNSDPFEWRARLGSSFTNSGGVVHYASAIVVNAFYNAATLDSDVAIMRLARPASLGNGIQVATLAGTYYTLYDGDEVTAVGWGATTTNGDYPEQVRHVEIEVLNQELCASQYTRKVTDNMLCAGRWLGLKGACIYDEGGPLVHRGVVAGMVSWGSTCGRPGFPEVYVRLSKFADWIQENTNYGAVIQNWRTE